jgi:ubiquinone/menaquinone biosynthesis C-methylase UbiE
MEFTERESDAASFHEIAKVYDAYAKDSPDSARNSLEGKDFDHDWLNEKLKSRITAEPILDVGCGAGSISYHLDPMNVELIGIDLSSEMINLARSHYPQHAFYVMNAQSLRFPDRCFGGAVAYFSLIHLSCEQLESALRELSRVSDVGAPILLTLYGPGADKTDDSQEDTSDLGLNIHSHSNSELQALLKDQASLQVVSYDSRPAYKQEEAYERIFIHLENLG